VSTSQLPWPAEFLAPARWRGVQRLLNRCLRLNHDGALPGALMLVSGAGLGREALAVELAAALVCRSREGAACSCSSCERVRRGVHPDVEAIDLLPDKKEISIEQVRRVVEGVIQHPYEGLRRVYILASCHTPPLNAEASSALLKTLEEPPTHATFLLLASNPARVLPTIVSRAVELRVPAPEREELLATLALAHGLSQERAAEVLAAAHDDAELALKGGGDLPDALVRLDELISAALAGDGLAMLRAASTMHQAPGGMAAATGVLLSLATTRNGEAAEECLDAAAALVSAEARRVSLHLDAESTMVGALARVAVRRGSIAPAHSRHEPAP
jgi:DNA polymerase III, delta subunit